MSHQTDQLAEIYKALVLYGAPLLAGFGVRYVAQIASCLTSIKTSLAVVVTNIEGLTKAKEEHADKLDDHSERIAKLEAWNQRH